MSELSASDYLQEIWKVPQLRYAALFSLCLGVMMLATPFLLTRFLRKMQKNRGEEPETLRLIYRRFFGKK
jgi:hypothetical protein